jgi:pimeloyl-ACP methyl ester carboxylesterase
VARAFSGGIVNVSERTVTVWDPPLEPTIFEAGPSDGEPLVFLHSGSGINACDPLLEALAGRFRVIAPLHPGFTDPDELEELRDVHDLALYHDELFEALGLEQVNVMGHSFGGMVAAELAAHYPKRVRKLVLVAPVGLWNDDYPMADLFTAFPFAIHDLLWGDSSSSEAQEAMAAMAKGLRTTDTDDPMVAILLQTLPGLITIGKYMWPLPDRGLVRRLRRITADTLVVWGEKDKLMPSRYADDFVAGIPNAKTAFLPDVGHMAPYERTQDFLKLVTDLLS